MRRVSAQTVPWKEPTHRTAEEAIAYARTRALKHKSANEAPFLRIPLDRVTFSDDTLEIGTRRGGLVAHIVDGSPVYTLVNEAADPCRTAAQSDAVEIQLEELCFVWDRPAIIQKMLSSSLVQIDASPDLLWLYFSAVGIIAVSVLIDKETGRPFLFWEPSD